jgi:hypothetical protein
MTAFGLLIGLCGMTPDEAAAWLGQPPADVAAWAAAGHPPAEHMARLRDLFMHLRDGGETAADAMEAHRTPGGRVVVIAAPADDVEARDMGFPCLGAWRVSCGVAVAELDCMVELVPRGATSKVIHSRPRMH